MPEIKQPNSSKVQSKLHNQASEVTSTSLRVNYFANSVTAEWEVIKDLSWKHTVAVQSIKEVHFMKLKDWKQPDILRTCCTRFWR